MLNKRSITLAALFVFGAASIATATEFDPNPNNRYPALNGRIVAEGYPPLQTAPVSSPQSRRVSPAHVHLQAPPASRPVRDDAPTLSGGGY